RDIVAVEAVGLSQGPEELGSCRLRVDTRESEGLQRLARDRRVRVPETSREEIHVLRGGRRIGEGVETAEPPGGVGARDAVQEQRNSFGAGAGEELRSPPGDVGVESQEPLELGRKLVARRRFLLERRQDRRQPHRLAYPK